MENLKASTKTIRVSYSDPDATDSSSDEESDKTHRHSKRTVHEIEVEFVENNQNPRSDSGNFQEKMGFKKPNLTSQGKKIVGVRMRKSGKFSAEIRDPIKKRRFWLGTFATGEEASMAFLAKKSQFAATLRAKQRIDWVDPSDLTSFQKGETKTISGVRRRDSGKFSAEIRNPITERRVWIGTFAPEEEESRAYLAKKSQFAAALRAKQRGDWVIDKGSSGLSLLLKGERKGGISGVRRRDSGKFCAEITNPITKRRVWIGSFATEEEAYRAYLAKEAEFEDELRAKQGSEKSLAARYSVPSVLEIDLSNDSAGGESVGETKVPGNPEAEFGFLFGVQVVDKNGFLVGEFSVLDTSAFAKRRKMPERAFV